MGFMDPEGPEEPRTYWIRRAVVAIPVVVVIVAIILLVTQLGGGGQPTTAEPPAPSDAPTSPTLQPADPSTPPPSSPSGQPSNKSSDAPSGDPTDKPSGDPTDKPSGDPSDTPSSTQKPTDPPSTSKPSSTPTPPKPAACDPAVLRTTLTGPKTVQPEKKVTFEAGVINGGKTTCTFTLDSDDYVFRVHSGTDQIWTTEDCVKWLPEVEVELKPEQDITWKIDWTVQRSKGCDLVGSKLKAGTYAANSLLAGAPPAQQVMQLKD